MSAPTLTAAIRLTISNEEFMHHWRRLTGTTIGLDTRTPLDRMIDKATGHEPEVNEPEARELYEFIRDYIWAPSLRAYIEEESCTRQ